MNGGARKLRLMLLLAAMMMVGPACGGSTSVTVPVTVDEEVTEAQHRAKIRTRQAAAIERVLAADARLGDIRNHASELVPLHEAVESYVSALEQIDTRGCPRAFVDALAWHREAWRDALEFFEEYDSLRGELHELLETIRGYGGDRQRELEEYEKWIWSTWSEVEEVRRRFVSVEPSAPSEP